MPRIEMLYAYIAQDEGPDDEGLAAIQKGAVYMPLVGADMARSESLRRAAQRVANMTGKKLTLVRFSIRDNLEVIAPNQ